MTTAVTSPAWLLAELDRLDEECEYRLGPPGDGWTRVDALLAVDALDALADEVHRGRAHGVGAATASLLSGWIAAGTAGAAGVALALTGRSWSVHPTTTWVRLHPDGWACGVAAEVAEDAGGDADALGRRWADQTATLLSPAIDHLASRLPFGRPGMWGGVADGVVGHAMWLASRGGHDADTTWAAATRLVDHLAVLAPVPPARPRRIAVPWARGIHHASVRSTCCLHYRTAGGGLDRDGDDTCTSCPLRSDASRTARLQAWLATHPI